MTHRAVIFRTFGSSTELGGFEPGDRKRVTHAHAKHLVEEAQCAVYADSGDAELKKAVITQRNVAANASKKK